MRHVQLMVRGGVCLALLGVWAFASEAPDPCQGGETFRFEVQGSLTGGESWQSDYVLFWVEPGSFVDLSVRTLMTVEAGLTEGWSFSLRHDPSALQSAGGDFTVTGVSIEGTDTESVKNGGPPDFEDTEIEAATEGYTQGVVIDMDSEVTLPPCSDFVTSVACYQLAVPTVTGYYEVPLFFTHDLGDPPIDSVVVQEGQGNFPCSYSLTVGVYVSSYSKPYPSCTLAQRTSSADQTQLSATTEAETTQPLGYKDNTGFSGISFVWHKISVSTGPLHTVRVADLNLDGKLDLVVTLTGESKIKILWGNGSGRFNPDAGLDLVVRDDQGSTGEASDVAIGDLDLDGDDDIAALLGGQAAGAFGVRIFWNSGGSFSEEQSYWNSTEELRFQSIALGDIDGDDYPELVLGSDYGDDSSVFLYWNRWYKYVDPKDRKFESAGDASSPGAAPYWGFRYVALEEVVTGYDGPEIIGQGGAVGLEPKYWPIEAWDDPAYLPVDYNPQKFALDDLEGDGLKDLVVSSELADRVVYVSAGTGTYPDVFKRGDDRIALATEMEGVLTTAITLCDIDLDDKKRTDIAAAGYWTDGNNNNNNPQIQFWRNINGNNQLEAQDFEQAGVIDLSEVSSDVGKPLHLAAGNLNGDSLADFVLSGQNGSLVTVLQERTAFIRGDANDDGRINIADPISVLGFLFGGGPEPPCGDAADANDDGNIDIADPIKILGHLFGGEGPLPVPNACGVDPTWDKISCNQYEHCP